jgi:hypothetical protein
MKSLYLLLILLISALLIPASGCQSEQYQAIELIPAKSNLIAGIQVSKIVNDQDIINAYNDMEKEPDQPETFDKAMDELFEESGMRIRDFSFAWIFGDISDIEQTEYIGFIAEGTFNEDEFMKSVEERSGERFSTSDYKGHKLYTGKGEDFSITFLNDKLLLGGGTMAVRDSIDVSEGDAEPVKGQLLDTYNRYGNTLISLAMAVPEDARESFTEDSMVSEMPISMEAFNSIDVIGFSLDKDNETLSSRIEFHFTEADSVQDAHDTISGLISMFKGMMEEPDLKEFLGNIEVSASGSWLTIALETELTQLEKMIETVEE